VVTCPHKALQKLAKPTLDTFTIINENLILIRRKKRNLTLDAPIYLGFSILEYAKVKILSFHYNVMLKLYTPANLRICMSDTDSFLYHITTSDLVGDLSKILDHLDTSDYPETHPLYSLKNKKKLGVFKNELPNNQILEGTFLKPKLYALLLDDSEKKVGKGIKKSVLQNEINYPHYKNVYDTQKDFYVIQHNITSENHALHTSSQRKLALSCFDDKRYLVNNEISYPYGHYKIKRNV